MIGNFIAGHSTDKFGAKKVIIFSIAVQSFDLLMLTFFYKNLFLACVISAVWGITGWMYLVPIQHRLLSLSEQHGSFVVSLNSSVLYFGIAVSGFVGWIFISFYPANDLGELGFIIGLLAIVTTFFAFRQHNDI